MSKPLAEQRPEFDLTLFKAMHRDKGSNAKHHQRDHNYPPREEGLEEQRHDRQGWVRKYLDLADQAFRDDNGNDPTPNPA